MDSLYLLSGIVSPNIRRKGAVDVEKTNQTQDPRHPIYEQSAAISGLKSIKKKKTLSYFDKRYIISIVNVSFIR